MLTTKASRVARWLVALLAVALATAWPAPRPAAVGAQAACAGAPQLVDLPWVENRNDQYLTFDCPLGAADPQAVRAALTLTYDGVPMGFGVVSVESNVILLRSTSRAMNYDARLAVTYTPGEAPPLYARDTGVPAAGFTDRVMSFVAPVPVLRTTSPSGTRVGNGLSNMGIRGEGLTRRSVVRWRGGDGTVTVMSLSQVEFGDENSLHLRLLPPELTATVQTVEVSIYNPGPGGGTSAMRPFFVTETGNWVEAAVGSSASATGTAEAATRDGTVSAAASGLGTLVLAEYGGNPLAAAPPLPTSLFFDVYLASGSDFTSVVVRHCSQDGSSTVFWYDPAAGAGAGAWAPVTGQAYDPATGCITLTLTSASAPSIAQLTRTEFAVGGPPATAEGFFQPVNMTPAGGSPVYNTVKAGATVPLKFAVHRGAGRVTNPAAIQQPLRAVEVNCKTGTTDEVEQMATGGTALRYDATAGHFVYNWQTPAGKAGSCWSVTVATANEAVTLTAHFKLR